MGCSLPSVQDNGEDSSDLNAVVARKGSLLTPTLGLTSEDNQTDSALAQNSSSTPTPSSTLTPTITPTPTLTPTPTPTLPPVDPRVNFTAPDFTFQDMNGETVTLSQLRGHPVLVNYWTTWCPPCKREMPEIQEVYDIYRDQGLIVLSVNATYNDYRNTVTNYINNNGFTFTVLFDEKGAFSNAYRTSVIPMSYFIDSRGIIRKVIVGSMTKSQIIDGVELILGFIP
jgi:peroxiredoxin